MWGLAFFGLSYPIILLINIVFIIFWIWQRKIYVLISCIAVIVGLGNAGRFFQSGVFHKSGMVHRGVKLFSYNVRIFNLYNWEKGGSKRDDILNYINRQKCDIVCFQEFLTRENRPGQSLKNVEEKLPHLPFEHVFYTVRGKNSINYGIATYSKYPIINKGVLKFANSYNACIYSDILIKKDTIRLFNVHLESIRFDDKDYRFIDSLLVEFNSKTFTEARDISDRLKKAYIKRAQQTDQLERLVKNSPYPVVICGDFNDTPVSYTYHKARGNLKDAFMESGTGIGSTYRGSFPSFRIDFIFHSKAIRSTNYKTNYIEYSDHYPISCELEL